MATRPPPCPGESSAQLPHEMSSFFSLPNEDGSIPHQEYDSDQSIQYPPTTLSCVHCERIVGDSSALLFATRQMGTITLDRMVSVDVGLGGLRTSSEGEWDEFCNYKDISCGKCATTLGKMYFATTSKLSALQGKYTLCLTTLSLYHHGSSAPSLPIAATAEIYTLLHPSPDAVAESIDNVQTICVWLREEQVNISRELKKLGVAIGADVDLEDSGTSIEELDARDSWKERAQVLEGRLEKLETIFGEMKARPGNRKHLEAAAAVQRETGEEEEGEDEEDEDEEEEEEEEEVAPRGRGMPRKRQSSGQVVSDLVLSPPAPQQHAQKPRRVPPPPPPPPPTAINKRKRGSAGENVIVLAGSRQYIEVDSDPILSLRRSRNPQYKEVPNSQSADDDGDNEEEGEEEAAPGLAHNDESDFNEADEPGEATEEDNDVEDWVEPPAEKRRKAIAGPKKKVVGKKVSQKKKKKNP